MNRRDTCLDFKAKRVNIEAHVGDDIRFGVTLKINKVDLPASDYDVETFIYDTQGFDISETYNFVTDKLDGVAKFVLEDSTTTTMGAGYWTYAIVVTLINEADYDRSYINGALSLVERSTIQ